MRVSMGALGISLSDVLAGVVVGPTNWGTPLYDENGRYLGGSPTMDLYCGTIVGQTNSPQTCHIPSPAEIRTQVQQELSLTQLTPDAQAAALAAGDAAVAASENSPGGCAAEQTAAANYPELSALVGPSAVALMYGIQCDGTTSILRSGLLWGAVIGIGIFWMSKR